MTERVAELIRAALRWALAREQIERRHDLKGELQMQLRAAERDLEDAVRSLDEEDLTLRPR